MKLLCEPQPENKWWEYGYWGTFNNHILNFILIDSDSLYMCNDRSFYVVILEGYSVAGVHMVVLVHSNRMSGYLGNLALCSRHDGGGPSGTTRESVSLSWGLIASSTKKIHVVIL